MLDPGPRQICTSYPPSRASILLKQMPGFLLSPQYESMGSQYSGIGILFGFELLGNLVVFVFLCVVVYSFFKKKNSAPKNMIIYMLAILVYEAIDFVLGIAITGLLSYYAASTAYIPRWSAHAGERLLHRVL